MPQVKDLEEGYYKSRKGKIIKLCEKFDDKWDKYSRPSRKHAPYIFYVSGTEQYGWLAPDYALEPISEEEKIQFVQKVNNESKSDDSEPTVSKYFDLSSWFSQNYKMSEEDMVKALNKMVKDDGIVMRSKAPLDELVARYRKAWDREPW